MAIIYSYEQETNPQFSDLLLGTDVSAAGKPTKSFSIQSIVDLVQTGVPGGGTVTSIGTNSSTFVTLSGGPITTSGIISASLSATGTPSATTYLRGDNTWATIPSSLNTTYTITSAQNGSAANIRLTGSDFSQTLVTLAAGANIVLTDNGSNRITIGVTGLPAGSVTSVTADGGLYIASGSATVDPVLAVDLTGLNNYIKVSENQTTATSEDFIAFNQDSSENVKTTTLGAITPNALSAVKSYIDAGDVGDIRNDTDTFTTTAVVENIVSLTSDEYSALTPNANTLYLIVGAAASYTNTLAFTNNIVGTEYTIGGDNAGATRSGITGASYAFNTTITPNSGYYFSSGPTITNASGIFGTADETVYTILGGTVEQIVEPPITATLSVSTSGIQGTQFTLGGDLTGATQSGPAPLTYAFNTTATANTGYEFVTGPTISNASGTINGSQTVITTITGELQAIAPPQVTVTPQLINNFTGESSQVSLSVTPGSFSGDSPVAYTFNPVATANSGYAIENLTYTGDVSGSATSSKTAVMYANGNVIQTSSNAIVELDLVVNITGGSQGTAYNITGNLDGDQKSGAVPFTYSFNTNVTPATGYEFTSLTINNASGTTNQEGLQIVTTTITGTVQEQPDTVTATLNVVKNITGDQVYSITGSDTGAQQTGLPPFDYSFTSGVSIPTGYEWTTGPSITPSQPNSGTISADTTVTTTISGDIAAIANTYYGLQKCTTGEFGFTTNLNTNELSLSTNDIVLDTGENVYYRVTDSRPTTQGSVFVQLTALNDCPATLYYYIIENCANSSQLQYGYSTQPNLGSGDTFNYFSNCYKYYDVDPTESGTIDLDALSTCQCGPEQGTVNLTFSNNVTGSANTTTALSGFTSVTGNVGDPYTFTNSIVANTGYEFTSGPTWNPSAVITGTITSGTTNITQTVTGNVQAASPSYTALSLRMNLNNAPYGWTSPTLACNGTGTPLSVYVQPIYSNWTDVVGSNAKVYTNTGLTTILAATGGNEYYQEGSGNYLRIDNTGDALTYTSCPVEPTYNYYFAQPCGGGTTIYMRSVTAFSPGEVFKLSGDDTCYEVGASGAPINSNDPVESFPDCSACLPPQVTVTLSFSNNVTNNQFTTTSLTPGATITGNPGDSYQFVHTITTDPGYEFTSGPTWTDSVSNNGTGTINGTIPNSNTTITQSVSGVVEQEVVSCNCITVDVLNTQLTDGGLNLYYIFNSCGVGETSVDLTTLLGVEQNGSTYFGLCEQGAGSNMYKYGPNGSPFVGLPGMNTTPNQTSCSSDFDCFPVVP